MIILSIQHCGQHPRSVQVNGDVFAAIVGCLRSALESNKWNRHGAIPGFHITCTLISHFLLTFGFSSKTPTAASALLTPYVRTLFDQGQTDADFIPPLQNSQKVHFF